MGDVTAPQAPPAQGAKGQPFLRDLLRRLIRERPVGAVSAAIVLLLCLVAIFADVLAGGVGTRAAERATKALQKLERTR